MNDLRSQIESIVGSHLNSSSLAFGQAVDRLEETITAAADTAHKTEIDRQIKAIDLAKIVIALSTTKLRKRRSKAADAEAKPALPLPPPPLPLPSFNGGHE